VAIQQIYFFDSLLLVAILWLFYWILCWWRPLSLLAHLAISPIGFSVGGGHPAIFSTYQVILPIGYILLIILSCPWIL
jgi:hypothetical protein